MSYRKFATTLPARFADADQLGHINNAVYHTYIEQCRVLWMEELLEDRDSFDVLKLPIILARTEMDYVRQAQARDQLVVECFLSYIGDKSFHQRYTITQRGNTVAVAKSVLVWFDYHLHQSSTIPADVRSKMRAYLPADMELDINLETPLRSTLSEPPGLIRPR